MKPTAQYSVASHGIHAVGWTAALLALLITAFWGGNAVATRFATDAMPPIAAAGVRFAFAAIFMLAWCRVERCGLRLRAGQYGPTILLGVLMALQIGLFNIGVVLSNASHAVMLVNTALFWVLGIEHFVTLSHRMTGRKLIGVMFAAVGAILVLGTSGATKGGTDDPSLTGDLILLLSAFVLGVKIVYTRYAVKRVEPGKLIFWHDVIGVLCFIGCSVLLNENVEWSRVDGTVAAALAYQGFIVGGFCFAMHAWLLQKHSGSQISIFGFAAPVFGVAAAWVFRNDPMSLWFIAAVACVAGGIVLVNIAPNHPESDDATHSPTETAPEEHAHCP